MMFIMYENAILFFDLKHAMKTIPSLDEWLLK